MTPPSTGARPGRAGKPVTGYEVLGETGTTKLLGKTGPDATSLVISGLADGVGYDFVVRALDEDGLGPPSRPQAL